MENVSIEKKAERAEDLLSAFLSNVVCVPQEWDERVDCLIKLADGSIIGEMIPLAEINDARVLATGERLRRRIAGSAEPLVNEIKSPIRIVKTGKVRDGK